LRKTSGILTPVAGCGIGPKYRGVLVDNNYHAANGYKTRGLVGTKVFSSFANSGYEHNAVEWDWHKLYKYGNH
jgi:hypothetical protein